MWGGALFLEVSHARTLRGRGPRGPNFGDSLPLHTRLYPKGAQSQRSQFWGFPSLTYLTLCCRTTNFDLVTYQGGVYILMSHVMIVCVCV